MTAVVCKQCDPPRQISSPQGLASHIRSMHPAALSAPPPSNGVRWEDPPPPQSGPRAAMAELARVVVELKRHPGRWARVRDFKSRSGAGSTRQRVRKEHPDCEWQARAMPEGSALFGRFVEEV